MVGQPVLGFAAAQKMLAELSALLLLEIAMVWLSPAEASCPDNIVPAGESHVRVFWQNTPGRAAGEAEPGSDISFPA